MIVTNYIDIGLYHAEWWMVNKETWCMFEFLNASRTGIDIQFIESHSVMVF